jgi:hypothetical protein
MTSPEEILSAAIRNKLTIDELITLSPPHIQSVIYCREHQKLNCVHEDFDPYKDYTDGGDYEDND